MNPCIEKRLGYADLLDEPVLTNEQWFVGCRRAFSWRYQRNGVFANSSCIMEDE